MNQGNHVRVTEKWRWQSGTVRRVSIRLWRWKQLFSTDTVSITLENADAKELPGTHKHPYVWHVGGFWRPPWFTSWGRFLTDWAIVIDAPPHPHNIMSPNCPCRLLHLIATWLNWLWVKYWAQKSGRHELKDCRSWKYHAREPLHQYFTSWNRSPQGLGGNHYSRHLLRSESSVVPKRGVRFLLKICDRPPPL